MRKRSRLARIALLSAVVAASTVVLASAPAVAVDIPGSDCATNQFRLLFWPKGHKAIKSVGFPAFAPPHVELYTGTGKKFPATQQVGYVDATKGTTSTKSCTPTTFQPQTGTLSKSATKTTQLVCKFASNPVVVGGSVQAGGGALSLYVNGRAGAYVVIGTTGSKLQYDPKACKATKPPH